MNSENQVFFNALKRINNNIDINNLNVDEILIGYGGLAKMFNEFINEQKNTTKAHDSLEEKKKYDKMLRYWIDPVNIAIRNAIGKTEAQKPTVEIKNIGQGDKAELTDDTKQEIWKANQQISQKNDHNSLVIPKGEYQFKTGVDGIYKSYIHKYEFNFKYNEKIFSKELYGNINIQKFHSDNTYRRVVLEAIEDLEIKNYNDKVKNNYIGTIDSYTKDEKEIYIQVFNEGDRVAIEKINAYNEACSKRKGDER